MTMTNLSKKRIVLIMGGIMLGLLLASLDGTIVSTAMPQIISSLKGFDYYAWPFTAFFLCMTISMPLFGKLADIYGFKSIYLFGIITFLVGSALCGVSQTMLQLIIFRGLQGVGAAILVSNSLALIGILFPPEQRAKYIGIAASAGALASVIGPALGGYITDNLNWRWIFYINIPVGILALVVISIGLPSFKETQEKKKVDYAGAAALIIALVPLLLAFTWGGKDYAWNSVQIIGMFVFSLMMLTAFIFIEKKAQDPIIPLSLFRNSIFNFSAIEMFLMSAVLIGVAVFLPLFVQKVVGSTASQSGAILTPLMLSLIAGSILSGVTVSKTHKYKIQSIIGFIIMSIGTLLLLRMGVKTENSTVIINMIVIGFGTGVVMPIFNVTAQNAFPESQMGVVTSSIQFFKSMGQTIAASVLGTILISSVKNSLQKLDTGKLPENVANALKDSNSSSNTEALKKMMDNIPNDLLPTLNKVMGQIKQILSDSVHNIFLICFVMAVVAMFAVFFMKEIPLSKTSGKDSNVG